MRGMVAAIAVLAVVSAMGCAHGPYVGRTYGPGRVTVEQTEKIVFTDRSLASSVRVVQANSSTAQDGRMEVFAELENMTGRNLAVQAQTQFRDANGNLMRDETNWRTIIMPPHSSTSYQTTSMSTDARDYVIRVKPEEARD